jgi:hypothetical protein
MAKVSARGAHKVLGLRVNIPDNLGADPEHETWYYKWAVRSDGAVLRATARSVHGAIKWNDGGSYKIIGRLKPGMTATDYKAALERKYGAENVQVTR